jgi:nicotinic acid phosphoribosyltransferase
MTQKADHSIHLALSEDQADVYFVRTQTVLEKEGLNPTVTMEIFPSRDGIICGMKEVLDLLRTVLPGPRERLGHSGTRMCRGGRRHPHYQLWRPPRSS